MYPDEPGQAYYEDVPPGHTQPYPQPPASLRLSEPAPAPSRPAPLPILICCLAALASLALAAWVTLGPKPVDHAAARQIAALQQSVKAQGQELANTKQALARTQQDNASLADRLAGTQGRLSKLTPYNQECSAPVTGPSGNPIQGYFRCSLAHQG
jgi:hypothetical protein